MNNSLWKSYFVKCCFIYYNTGKSFEVVIIMGHIDGYALADHHARVGQ